MKPFFSRSVQNRFRFVSIRLLICGLAVLVYLMIWRPMRVAVAERVVFPQVEYFEDRRADFNSRFEAGALKIDYSYDDGTKQLQYRPQFGLFFLVTLLAFIFVTDRWKHYWILLGLHLAASILTYVFLLVGASGFQVGFILTDAISGYLTPALSLALVPLVIEGVIK